MSSNLYLKKFADINLNDPFFDSLKKDYTEFEIWFQKKANDNALAYVSLENHLLQGFLYIKEEDGKLIDINPQISLGKCLKIGTFKINPHGTRLGERFIKKIFDAALEVGLTKIYVTVFPKHAALIYLFEKYNFKQIGTKTTDNGVEMVLLKDMNVVENNLNLDYPRFKIIDNKKYLLSVYPTFHTRLFPDSKLINESDSYSVIKDVSHTNSIYKIYICFMDVSKLKRGDLITIYRTSDNLGPARYRSVATSLCVVDELKSRESFKSLSEFLQYCTEYSVFTEEELKSYYNRPFGKVFVIRMTYNSAFKKRITRGSLIDELGLSEEQYWGFMELADDQFNNIIVKGEVNESLIIN